MIEYGIFHASFRHRRTTKNTLLIIFTDPPAFPVHAINVLPPPFVANRTVFIDTTVLTLVFSRFLARSFRMSISQEVFSTTIAFNRVFGRGTSSFRQQGEKRGHRTGLGDELNSSNLPQANAIHLLDRVLKHTCRSLNL